MGSVNKVILVGNLGRDAELRYTPGGAAVATLNLATTEVWNDKNQQRQEKTEWHRVVLWGKQAESLQEYLTKGKHDRDHLKSMMSRQIDGPARMAYAHIPVERPRQFIIIGTTNNDEYLMDTTGARRFWPVKIQQFDVEGILRDRDQLWAEAVRREASGESIRLPQELWIAASEHQEKRREVDAWEDAINHLIELTPAGSTGRQQLTAESLWNALSVPVERRDRTGARRISEIMQRRGFSRTNVREKDRVVTGYVREVAPNYIHYSQRLNESDM